MEQNLIQRHARYEAAERFRKSPKPFFRKVLGVEILEEYQDRVLDVVADNDRIAISACHDVGKSFLMARIAMWFLNCFPNSKVITTAPTFNQVERILWSEIRAAHSKSLWPLGGKLNTTDWTFNPEWWAIGLSPRNESSNGEGQGTQSSFQGFHADYLLVIFDEATGIAPAVWTMAEGLLTSANVKFVAIGNPTSMNSEFYKCFKDPAWAKVYLSCFDSPNLKANNIHSVDDIKREVAKLKGMSDEAGRQYLKSYKVVRPYLLTAKWVVESARKWGIEHPLTVSKILGKFPEGGDDTLISLGQVEQASLRLVTPSTATDRKTIGVDVARFGKDASILTGLHGLKQLKRKAFYKRRTTEIVGEVIALAREMGGVDVIVIDETGLGAGVVDGLVEAKNAVETKELLRRTEIRGIQFGAACENKDDKEKYVNEKARMFGLLALDIDSMFLMDESVYQDELPSIRKRYNSKGQLVIASKDEYKKAMGRDTSPDNADSLALANLGRYDDLKVGIITDEILKTKSTTMSGGLSSQRKW